MDVTDKAETDADKVAAEAAIAKRKLAKRQAEFGIRNPGPTSKVPRIGSVEPRNSVEVLFFEKYGTVTPVPDDTMARCSRAVNAAISVIHYGTAVAAAGRIFGFRAGYLEKVAKRDKWDEFGQTLAQLNRASMLSIIPQHDGKLLSEEVASRLKKLPSLKKTELGLVRSLKGSEPGSREQTNILTNLKKIRELIDDTIGLDDYKREVSSARGTALKAKALMIASDDLQARGPKQVEGQIIEL